MWLNPPYGRGINGDWAEKTLHEWQSGRPDSITALVPANTATQWFVNNYGYADYITFLSQRIEFITDKEEKSHNATFGNAIVSFGDFPESYFEALLGISRPGTDARNIITLPFNGEGEPQQRHEEVREVRVASKHHDATDW